MGSDSSPGRRTCFPWCRRRYGQLVEPPEAPRRLVDFSRRDQLLDRLGVEHGLHELLEAHWLRLKSSRSLVASPIWRMPPAFLFQIVLDRLKRVGMATAMSRPLPKASLEDVVRLRLTILPMGDFVSLFAPL